MAQWGSAVEARFAAEALVPHFGPEQNLGVPPQPVPVVMEYPEPMAAPSAHPQVNRYLTEMFPFPLLAFMAPLTGLLTSPSPSQAANTLFDQG